MLYIIKPDNKVLKTVLDFLSKLPTNKSWDIEIVEHKSQRSKQQNRYYWAILNVLSDFNGDEKEDLHDRFAVKFIGIEVRSVKVKNSVGEVCEEILRRPYSTTKLSTKEFSEYLDKVILTIGVAFPELVLPDPQHFGYDI